MPGSRQAPAPVRQDLFLCAIALARGPLGRLSPARFIREAGQVGDRPTRRVDVHGRGRLRGGLRRAQLLL